jgi:hypothetical protein
MKIHVEIDIDAIANVLFALQRRLEHEANQMPRRAREIATRMRGVADVAYETADAIVEIKRDDEAAARGSK